ncbi:Uncharacterized protein C13G6.05c [Golovinomyces cichoracearum]|uniref:Uncharacterized protein C13G6.05c n=1 Tax=Golovinomyces cichoracearum TaxID=62708 RepID=A0A420HDL9_9PEZI|nr:Uncharacterized protein C13G6.05c [Golovinomyces cichoracearum]
MSTNALLPPSNFSDPTATYLNLSCLDLLMIELVPTAYRIVNEVDAISREGRTFKSGNLGGASSSMRTDGSAEAKAKDETQRATIRPSLPPTSSGAGTTFIPGSRRMEEDEEKDAVFFRLETLGYRVGQGLVERFSRERPRFTNTLDVIKFICKDLWVILFRKQLDNLKTNHRGVYVLTDNSFRPFARMSAEAGGQAVIRAQPFLWFPCGIIRGALANMGIEATVQAETNELPAAIFQIKSIVKS